MREKTMSEQVMYSPHYQLHDVTEQLGQSEFLAPSHPPKKHTAAV